MLLFYLVINNVLIGSRNMNCNRFKPQKVYSRYRLSWVVYSCIGIFFFFVPHRMAGKENDSTGSYVSWLRKDLLKPLKFMLYWPFLAGGAYPFVTGKWRVSKRNCLGSIFLKCWVLSRPWMHFLSMGLRFIRKRTCCHSCFSKLVVPVGLIVPMVRCF